MGPVSSCKAINVIKKKQNFSSTNRTELSEASFLWKNWLGQIPTVPICTAGTVNVRVAWSEWGFVSNYRFMMSFFFRDDCKLNHCSLIRFSQPIPVHQNLNGRLLLKRRIADKIILKRMPVKSMASSYRLTVCWEHTNHVWKSYVMWSTGCIQTRIDFDPQDHKCS